MMSAINAFVTKLTASGALSYSTYLGGSHAFANGIAVDNAGNAYVTGVTSSDNFPTLNAFQGSIASPGGGIPDAFVTKLNASGGLSYSTYFGGDRDDWGNGIATDSAGNAYVTGFTRSTNFPTLNAFQPDFRADLSGSDGNDAFVTKLTATGGLGYSTYLGGSRDDLGKGIALDAASRAYVTGQTSSPDFPTANPLQPFLQGGSDSFVAKIFDSSVFSVEAIVANKGGNSGDVSVSVLGAGFQLSATVKLKAPGQLDIEGANPIVVSTSRISTTFNLRGATPGLRDVVITLPDGSTVVLRDAFTVEEGGKAQVWVDIIGRDTIRAGRPQTYTIIYGNRGKIDAVGVPLWIGGIPKDATLQIGFEVTAPIPLEGEEPNDWSEIPIHVDTDDEKLLPLFVPVVRPGGSGVLRISLTVPTQREFQLRAWANPPYFQSPLNPQVGSCVSAIATVAIPRIVGSIPGVGCLGSITIALGESINAAMEYSRNLPSADTSTIVFSLVQIHTDALDRVISIGKACEANITPGLSEINAVIQDAFAVYDIYDGCKDLAQKTWEKITPPIRTVQSLDPNDKVGAVGTGSPRYISGEEPLRYAIYFENTETATAPAQEVVIADQLDTAKLDLNTFSFGPIAFGNKLVTPPSGLSEFNQDIDLRPANNLIVRINARLDKSIGLLTWRLAAIDPATGLPPDDPLAGFLPPNVNAPEGEGSVFFTVMPKHSLPTGMEIRNQAQIFFDANAPLDTPQWFNTLDNSAPASHIHALTATPCSANLNVQWSGTDTGSGIRDYAIYVSDNGGPFVIWQSNTTAAAGVYSGQFGHAYAFYSVAQDQTGNIENAPTSPDTAVTLGAPPPPPTITLTGQIITLWPPNHQYETVSLAQLVASASDNCGSNLTGNVVIAQVSSDEPEDAQGGGDGNTLNDIVIAPNCKSVLLRAERNGSGNGRVYTITFKVRDAAGNTATATAKVRVPKSQNGNLAVDDGPSYTVTRSCP